MFIIIKCFTLYNMGIKNLHRVLEKYAPGCYKTKHLSEYSYKKVAIDISLYLYKYKAISGDRWIESFIALVNALRKWDVHCIFIYDGQAPVEKLEEQKRRRDTRAKMGDKIKELEKQIKEYEDDGKIGNLIEELCKKESVSLFRKKIDPIFDISLAKDKLESMKGMMISITPEDIIKSQNLFDVMNIPYVKAPAEAECYASHLCKYDKVDCVLSEDTDVLAYGTPVFLTKIDVYKDTVVEITYDKILEETGMTYETFTDLCIMCSCDYNSNIYMVGPEKSYSMLKTFGRIEKILEELKTLKNKDGSPKYTDEMFDVLKYERCREMFTTHPVEFYAPYCGVPDFSKLEEFFYTNNIRFNIEKLKKNFQAREVYFDDSLVEDIEDIEDEKDEKEEDKI